MPIRSTEGWVRLRLSQAPDGIQGFCACLKFKAVEKSAFWAEGRNHTLLSSVPLVAVSALNHLCKISGH